MSTPTLIIKDALSKSAEWLAEKKIASPRLDAELLLAHVLKLQRLDLYLAWDRPLSEAEKKNYRDLLKRRSLHEPIAYIVGKKEFFSLEFLVTPDVLIPRPETELLVERALELVEDLGGDALRIADVGTGSGAIAVALAHELPGAAITAMDVSAAALDVARKNAEKHGVDEWIEFQCANLLEGIEGPLDWVISNLPYIGEIEKPGIMPDVLDFEPHEALFAGQDGLDLIRTLIPQSAERLCAGGWLMMEIGAGQGEAVTEIIHRDGRFNTAELRKDLAGLDRVISAQRI